MSVRHAWTSETEASMLAAGWHPRRSAREIVSKWRDAIERSSTLKMSPAAEEILAEFGGLRVTKSGPGIQCARGGFVINPTLAAGEDDRFAALSDFVVGDLFPIGEAYDGHAFLGVDHAGSVYLVGDSLERLGKDIYSSLDAILEGRLPQKLANRGRW